MIEDNIIKMPGPEVNVDETLAKALEEHKDKGFSTIIILAIDRDQTAHYLASGAEPLEKSFLSDFLKSQIMLDFID